MNLRLNFTARTKVTAISETKNKRRRSKNNIFGNIEYKLGTYVSRIFVTKILIILICPWYMDYFKRTSNEITQCKILGPIIFFFSRSLSIQTVLLFGRYLIGIFP